MTKVATVLAIAALVLCGCSSGVDDSMNTQQAAQTLDRKAEVFLPLVPDDAPPPFLREARETKCGSEGQSPEESGVRVSRQYIIVPTTPDLARRTFDVVTTELLRLGYEIETDRRNREGPALFLFDPADGFYTTVSTSTNGGRVTFTVRSPCVAPV